MAQSRTLSVGMAVHKASSAVASVAPDPGVAVLALGPVGTQPWALDQLRRPLQSNRPPRVGVYDASPCGSWFARSLTQQGATGWGVAPAWLPPKTGERGTTDRRDALPLARLRRAGDLPPGLGPRRRR
jgi:hypothetical protein